MTKQESNWAILSRLKILSNIHEDLRFTQLIALALPKEYTSPNFEGLIKDPFYLENEVILNNLKNTMSND